MEGRPHLGEHAHEFSFLIRLHMHLCTEHAHGRRRPDWRHLAQLGMLCRNWLCRLVEAPDLGPSALPQPQRET